MTGLSVCSFVSVSVCVCLSVLEHIPGTAGPIFTKFFVQILCGCGSVIRWWHCNTLCTCSFMDDVTFGHNGPCTFTILPLAALCDWGGV